MIDQAIPVLPGKTTNAPWLASPRKGAHLHHTHLSILVLLGPCGLQKGAHELLGHGEQRRASVHDGLAALGAPARGLVSNEEPERGGDGRPQHLPAQGS